MEDAFARCHPAVNLLYFALVLTGTMFFWHPACQLLSLGFGLAYLVYLEHWPAVCRRLRWMVPLFVLTALINPAFSHAGATILAYFPSGNPLTLESIWFGLASAGMLLAALCWCFCCADILTTDKIVCLLGRALPALSLLLAMALRFVPRLRRQMQEIARAQAGLPVRGRGLLARARRGAHLCSALISWALENAVVTADSMKSRGYGLPGRSAFTLYRLSRRDKILLGLEAGGALLMGLATAAGLFRWKYYPVVQGTWHGWPVFGIYAALLALPLLLNWKEDHTWRVLQSNI